MESDTTWEPLGDLDPLDQQVAQALQLDGRAPFRRIGEVLEILAGHNRVNAAKLAGLSEVPAIILENISDEEAWIYIIETNLMQRSFADMSHSEKAAVIATQHSKLFSQGKRNDIINDAFVK